MTERMDIQSVLAQMRTLKTQVQQGVGAVDPKAVLEGQRVEKSDFSDLLSNAINKVNNTQLEAKHLTTAFEAGDPAVDLPQVMIGLQKASVSFQAMTQVRNRLVSAYEDIMKMPI